MKKIIIAIISTILSLGGIMNLVSCDNTNKNTIKTDTLTSVISSEKLISGTPISLENSPCFSDQAQDVAAPENYMEEKTTGKTGEKITINRENESGYGGGQFISKLFTEGLSRAATGEEFSTYQQYILENGCNADTLKTLAKAVFNSKEFKSFSLAKTEITFAVYRAILSRDPNMTELGNFNKDKINETIDEICSSVEFQELLPSIVNGPYFWRGNNAESYTDGTVITRTEFYAMLSAAAKTKVVELPQGALIKVDTGIIIPDGYTIKTQGNPNHYTKFARFLRTTKNNMMVVTVGNNITLQNIFVDGNRCDMGKDNGWNILGTGSNNVIWGIRTTDPSANSPMHLNPDTTNYYVARNLVTDYGTDHQNQGWCDGIDIYSNNSIIEYNNVVDATDGGIVLFRNHPGEGGVQNSIVRYNTICNTGNSAYAGLDHEGVDTDGEVEDFEGCMVYSNQFYTSYVAHMHMCITLSSRPWTENFNKVKNNSVYNNYSAKGCFVNTAGGLIVEGVDNGTARGNQFVFHIGQWIYSAPGWRAYSVNSETCVGGDYQPGYVNLHATAFVNSMLDIERAKSYEVEVCYVYEETQGISKDEFNWMLD